MNCTRWALLPLLLLIAAGSSAQDNDVPPRTGVIDLEKISRTITDSDKSVTSLREKVKRVTRDYTQKKQKMDALDEELKRSEGVLSGGEQDKKRKELYQLRNELDEMALQTKRDMDLMQDTVVTPLRKKIEFAIEDVARKRHLQFVLKAEQLAWSIPSADITEAVIARLKELDQESATSATAASKTSTDEPAAVNDAPKTAAKEDKPSAKSSTAAGATPPKATQSPRPLRPVDRQAE